jgi:hypothetical protein
MDHERFLAMLTRLKLTAIRDQLDNVLEEAGPVGQTQSPDIDRSWGSFAGYRIVDHRALAFITPPSRQ